MNTSTTTAIREAAENDERVYSHIQVPIIRGGGRIEGFVESGSCVSPLEGWVNPEATSDYAVDAELNVAANGSVHVHYTYVPQHEDGIATYSPQDVRWMGYADGITAEETWAADIENAGYAAQEEVPELHDAAVTHMYEVVAEQLDVPNDAALRARITTSFSIAPWEIGLDFYEADFAEWEEQYEENE